MELERLHNSYERVVDDYGEKLNETQAALEASKPILTEATQLLGESREKCLKTEADLEATTAELEQQTKLLTAKEMETADLSRQMHEVSAKLTAAEATIATREVELDALYQQHSQQIQDIEDRHNVTIKGMEASAQGYVLPDEYKDFIPSLIERPIGPHRQKCEVLTLKWTEPRTHTAK